MKKFKISTVAAIAVYAMLVAGLSSCSIEYNDTDQSKFVIKEVLERKRQRASEVRLE